MLLSLPGAPSVFSVVNRQYNTEKPELQGNPRPSATIFLRLSGSERPPVAHGGQFRGVQQHQRLVHRLTHFVVYQLIFDILLVSIFRVKENVSYKRINKTL